MARVIYPSQTGIVPPPHIKTGRGAHLVAELWVLVNLTFWMRQSEQEVGYSFSLSVWNGYVELRLHCPIYLCACY